MKKVSTVLWGIVLVALGLLFALNALNITNLDIFFDGWWTLFIIVPCLIGLITTNERTGNIIGLLIGVFLLLRCQGVITFGLLWKLLIPAVIIIIGVKLVINGLMGNKANLIIRDMKANCKNPKVGCATFSGLNLNFSGEVFEGAELTAVFGGVKCDLRNAIIEKDCAIQVSAIFGGIDILMPENVKIKVNTTSLFGGVSDKTRNNTEGSATLFISGTCLFGGVDIK